VNGWFIKDKCSAAVAYGNEANSMNFRHKNTTDHRGRKDFFRGGGALGDFSKICPEGY